MIESSLIGAATVLALVAGLAWTTSAVASTSDAVRGGLRIRSEPEDDLPPPDDVFTALLRSTAARCSRGTSPSELIEVVLATGSLALGAECAVFELVGHDGRTRPVGAFRAAGTVACDQAGMTPPEPADVVRAPLHLSNGTCAALFFGFASPRRLDGAERRFLAQLADLASTSLDGDPQRAAEPGSRRERHLRLPTLPLTRSNR
jgi:hypothetical protein